MAKKKVLSIAEQEWAKYQKNEMGMNPNPLRSVEVVEAIDEEKKKGKKKASKKSRKSSKKMGARKQRRGKRSSSTGSGAQYDDNLPPGLADRKKQQQAAADAAKKAAADKKKDEPKKDEPKKTADEPTYTPAYIAWAKKNNMEAGAAGAQARYKAATGKGAIAAPASNGKKDPGKETITPVKK